MIKEYKIEKHTHSIKESESLIDSILDLKLLNKKTNPVVSFLADGMNMHPERINDVFRYYKYLGKKSFTEATEIISDSEQGFDFWFCLYEMYDRKNVKESYSKMINFIAKSIY